MKIAGKCLTWFLSFAMIFTIVPITFAGSNENILNEPKECVMYNLLDRPIYVSNDVEMAQDAPEQYKLFDENGNYKIQLEDNAFFPYEVLFSYQESPDDEWKETREWFDTPDSTVEVAGHTFSVYSEMNDSDKISQFGVYVGDEYVAARPAEKEFNDNGGISTISMQPLTEVNLSLDLSEYLPPELVNVKPEVIFYENEDINASDSDKVVWSKWSGWNDYEDDEFEVIDFDGSLDVSSSWNEYCTIEMIIGDADQLNPDNIRYIVQLKVTPGDEWLEYDSEWVGTGDHTNIKTNQNIDFMYNNNTGRYEAWIQASDPIENYSYEIWFHFPEGKYEDRFNDIKIYSENYTQTESGNYERHHDYTDVVWGESDPWTPCWPYENGQFREEEDILYTMEITSKNGDIYNVDIYIEEEYIEENITFDGLYDHYGNETFKGESTVYSIDSEEYISVGNKYIKVTSQTITYILKDGYSSDDANEMLGKISSTDDSIDKIYEGRYTTPEEAEAAGKPDRLNAFTGNGFEACYGNGYLISVITKNGNCYIFNVIATTEKEYNGPGYIEEDTTSNAVPEVDDWDPYFKITGVKDKDGNNIEDIYIVPYSHDTYYADGRQTVLINDTDVDLSSLKPVFTTGYGVRMYAGTDVDGVKTEGIIQKSGENIHNFSNGPVLYSAVSDGTHLRNYYVTFVKKKTGSSELFVNGINDAAEDENPIRRIYFNNAYGYYHDIFIGNIGDSDLSGLSVTLSDAKNICLDDYWKINSNSTKKLSAFSKTDTSATQYGELSNTAKIRLIPTDSNGDIEGKLTISADGQETVTIELTGKSGDTQIITQSLSDGVKYVPYSCVIQSDNMFSWNKVSFYTSSELPDGMKLYPNGELYGVPTEEGKWKIDVVMECQYGQYGSMRDKKTLEINIKTNSDSAVTNATDDGYHIIERIEDKQEYTEDELFWGNGALSYLEGVWLDGEKLSEYIDYTADEGSTKITVRAQTLTNINNGKHTIAMEYRTSDKQLKRTTQNFTKGSMSSGSGGGGGGGGSATPVSYGVAKNNTANGTFKVNPENAAAGKTVTITSVPNKGYETSLVTVKDAKGNIIQTVKGSNGTYTFVMPSSKVTVSVEFKLSNPSDLYDDVSTSDWFYPEVKWATESEYMNGVGNNLFKPNGQISEAVLVQVLARMAGVDTSKYSNENYSDIESGKWYSDAAKWAKAVGILGADGFSAQPPCSRGKLAVMLVKYFDAQGIKYLETGNGVIIADESDMSLDEARAFRILVEAGIFKGKGNNVMDPDGATTRAELAALMHRVSDYIFMVNE